MNTSPIRDDMGAAHPPGVGLLRQLVRRSIDLRQLYRHAAKACEPGLRLVLGENVQTLALVIGDLQTCLRDMGAKPPLQGSLRGSTHRHLAGWLMQATPRSELAWLRLLAHHETTLLQGFERTLAQAPSISVPMLRRQLLRLRAIELDMHTLAGPAGY